VGLPRAVREDGLLDWIRDAACNPSAGARSQVQDFRYYLGQVYVPENYLIASAYTVLVFLRAAAGAGPDPAAVPDGCFRRPATDGLVRRDGEASAPGANRLRSTTGPGRA
jgi:hypothetical protein